MTIAALLWIGQNMYVLLFVCRHVCYVSYLSQNIIGRVVVQNRTTRFHVLKKRKENKGWKFFLNFFFFFHIKQRKRWTWNLLVILSCSCVAFFASTYIPCSTCIHVLHLISPSTPFLFSHYIYPIKIFHSQFLKYLW